MLKLSRHEEGPLDISTISHPLIESESLEQRSLKKVLDHVKNAPRLQELGWLEGSVFVGPLTIGIAYLMGHKHPDYDPKDEQNIMRTTHDEFSQDTTEDSPDIALLVVTSLLSQTYDAQEYVKLINHYSNSEHIVRREIMLSQVLAYSYFSDKNVPAETWYSFAGAPASESVIESTEKYLLSINPSQDFLTDSYSFDFYLTMWANNHLLCTISKYLPKSEMWAKISGYLDAEDSLGRYVKALFCLSAVMDSVEIPKPLDNSLQAQKLPERREY